MKTNQENNDVPTCKVDNTKNNKSKYYYYDDCPLCISMMKLFRVKGEKLGIKFIDINDPKFKSG